MSQDLDVGKYESSITSRKFPMEHFEQVVAFISRKSKHEFVRRKEQKLVLPKSKKRLFNDE